MNAHIGANIRQATENDRKFDSYKYRKAMCKMEKATSIFFKDQNKLQKRDK
jgi:hypothetical protein